MTHPTVTMIVPRLPPTVDGLGDYGLILAQRLRRDYGIQTQFIVGDPNWSGTNSLDGFIVKIVKNRSALSLLELLPKKQNEANILLHYVGYGYAKRGCPLWLVKSLEQWREQVPEGKLLTMFHEVYAFGPIWTSQFWTSYWQRKLAARLIDISSKLMTNKHGYRNIIQRFGKTKNRHVDCLPVFSNMGEPQNLQSFQERKKQLIVFGSGSWRRKVYQESLQLLEKICQELDIEEVIDIGAPLGFSVDLNSKVKFSKLGIRGASEISQLMSKAKVGILNYPISHLAKSGIFAAYCSHGLLPVVVTDGGSGEDGLCPAENYWPIFLEQKSIDNSTAQLIAQKAYNWYHQHGLAEHAKIYMKYFNE